MNDYSDREFKISVILAMTEDCAIGRSSDNTIPWDCSPDRHDFYMLTGSFNNSHNITLLVMGSKTFESLPYRMQTEGSKHGRHRLIISRSETIDPVKYPNSYILNDIANLKTWVTEQRSKGIGYNLIYYIGGAYHLPRILRSKSLEYVYLTVIRDNDQKMMATCDVKIDNPFKNESLEIHTWDRPREYDHGVYFKYVLKPKAQSQQISLDK